MDERLETSRAESLVVRALRIPPPPEPPIGSPGSTRIFRAARGRYYYQLLVWAGGQAAAAAGLIVGFTILDVVPDFPGSYILDVIEWLGVATFIAALPFTLFLVRLDYRLRWYVVTDRSLRIREGVLHISEKTMSFANIQNIAVKQGPVQRLLGIADVEVRTAGGGGPSTSSHESGGTDMHLAYFRGVDNAEEIRDAILERVRQLRDSGLGDPDAVERFSIRSSNEALEAGLELLSEVRALREALSAGDRPSCP